MLQVLSPSAFPPYVLIFSSLSNSLQPSLVSSTSSQICKLPVAVPSILWTFWFLLIVCSYTCAYWSGDLCIPVRRAEGVSICLQNDVPGGVFPSNTISGVKAFEFSLSSAEPLSRHGISLNLWELSVFEIFHSLLNWVVTGRQVTVSLICLWEKQVLSFWNWY